jgi:hypothetical protein
MFRFAQHDKQYPRLNASTKFALDDLIDLLELHV